MPNVLTASRIAALPLLWGLAAAGEMRWLALGVAVAASTDVLDGFLARRSHGTTPFGSRLDSVADHLLTASVLAWLVWRRGAALAPHAALVGVWAAAAAVSLTISLLRFRRPVDLHLYSSKAAGFLGYVLAIQLLLTGHVDERWFRAVLTVLLLAQAEAGAVLLTRSRVDEHLGSILRKSKRGGSARRESESAVARGGHGEGRRLDRSRRSL